MTKATFDLFDASLGDAFAYFQDLPDEARFANYRHQFSIDPRNWEENKPAAWAFNLPWNEYRYSEIDQRAALDKLIPTDDPGIYIFYVRPDRVAYRFPQFAFYIGISNEGGSKRPLRERLKDYLPTSVSKINKRDNIHRMLQLYFGRLWVAYALTEAHADKLEDLEMQLHGYVHPCYSRRDFPASIKRQQRAFGVI